MIRPRSDWAEHSPRIGAYRHRHGTSAIVVHHSGAPRDQSIEAIRRAHTNRGWFDIGYHYVIRLGETFEARPLHVIGSHCRGINGTSVGVCVLGDYTAERPQDEDRRALLQLLAHLLERWPGAEILGHGEAAPTTACPGRLLEGVREELPTTPGWRGYGVRPLLT